MTPATTQVIINVIFERFADVELGNKSKFSDENNPSMRHCVFLFLHRLYMD